MGSSPVGPPLTYAYAKSLGIAETSAMIGKTGFNSHLGRFAQGEVLLIISSAKMPIKPKTFWATGLIPLISQFCSENYYISSALGQLLSSLPCAPVWAHLPGIIAQPVVRKPVALLTAALAYRTFALL